MYQNCTKISGTNVLARRASRRPMDTHFWGKNTFKIHLILIKYLQETCSLDAQLSISG